MKFLFSTILMVTLWASPSVAHDWNGIAVDSQGSVYVVDADCGQIWKVGPGGTVGVFLSASKAKKLEHPHHLAFDQKGMLWLGSG